MGHAPPHMTDLLYAYAGASVAQHVVESPFTVYRELIHDYKRYGPAEARAAFGRGMLTVSCAGIVPRLVGSLLRKIPKYGIMIGVSRHMHAGQDLCTPAVMGTAGAVAVVSTPAKVLEKQQIFHAARTGAGLPVGDLWAHAARCGYRTLFRGALPYAARSSIGTATGIVLHPRVQSRIEESLGCHTTRACILASAALCPVYVIPTAYLSRMETYMQSRPLASERLTLRESVQTITRDVQLNGWRGMCRGMASGMLESIVSLSAFHLTRICILERLTP